MTNSCGQKQNFYWIFFKMYENVSVVLFMQKRVVCTLTRSSGNQSGGTRRAASLWNSLDLLQLQKQRVSYLPCSIFVFVVFVSDRRTVVRVETRVSPVIVLCVKCCDRDLREGLSMFNCTFYLSLLGFVQHYYLHSCYYKLFRNS